MRPREGTIQPSEVNPTCSDRASHQEQEPALEVADEPGHFIGHVVKPNTSRLRFQATVNVIERGGDKVNGQWDSQLTWQSSPP